MNVITGVGSKGQLLMKKSKSLRVLMKAGPTVKKLLQNETVLRADDGKA